MKNLFLILGIVLAFGITKANAQDKDIAMVSEKYSTVKDKEVKKFFNDYFSKNNSNIMPSSIHKSTKKGYLIFAVNIINGIDNYEYIFDSNKTYISSRKISFDYLENFIKNKIL